MRKLLLALPLALSLVGCGPGKVDEVKTAYPTNAQCPGVGIYHVDEQGNSNECKIESVDFRDRLFYMDHRGLFNRCYLEFLDMKSNGPGVDNYVMDCVDSARDTQYENTITSGWFPEIKEAPSGVQEIAKNIEADYQKQEGK